MSVQSRNARRVDIVPREVLFGNPQRSSVSISGDGKYLAYLAPDKNNVLNVWLRNWGEANDRQITCDKNRGVRFFFWRHDYKHILYMQDENGDENWRVYQTNIETAETKDLTPFPGVNSYILATNKDFPDEILIGSNKRNRHFMDAYRLDLKSETLTLDTENPGDVAGFIVDHDMRVRIAHVMRQDGGIELRIRDSESADWQELISWGADESNGGALSFTPDNRGVYLMTSVSANAARLIECSIIERQQRVIAQDPQFDLASIFQDPNTHIIQAVEFVRERNCWEVLDESVAADFSYLREKCRGNFYITARTHDDNLWIVADNVDDGSVEYLAYKRGEQKLDSIFLAQPELNKYELSPMKAIKFQSRDGMTIHGYLTMPLPNANESSEAPALVLLVHGGPWARDVWGFRPEVQWLANRGYAVLQVNFRGSIGYGKDYYNAGDRQWSLKMHDDLIDAKRWLIKEGKVAQNKVAIFGTSYGGYATLVGLAFTPDEFVCGVDVVGPSNLVTLLSSIPPYWDPVKAQFKKRVGDVETEKEFLESCSPLFKAHEIKAPLLIAQGAQDPRVKQAESDQIVAAMRKNSQEVEYLLIEDEGHGFAKPENRLRFYKMAEEFLAKHLGGRKE